MRFAMAAFETDHRLRPSSQSELGEKTVECPLGALCYILWQVDYSLNLLSLMLLEIAVNDFSMIEKKLGEVLVILRTE